MNFGENKSREEKTILVSQDLVRRGVEYLRVHDVATNKKAISS